MNLLNGSDQIYLIIKIILNFYNKQTDIIINM